LASEVAAGLREDALVQSLSDRTDVVFEEISVSVAD
jgi:hypothetical protein